MEAASLPVTFITQPVQQQAKLLLVPMGHTKTLLLHLFVLIGEARMGDVDGGRVPGSRLEKIL